MKATIIRVKNFLGTRNETSYRLTGKDLFLGPNGTGKTRVLEAFRYAITGKSPLVNDKTIWDLATRDPSINEFYVEVEFDSKFIVRRTFARTYDKSKKMKISQELSVYPPQGERTINDKELRISKEIGTNLIGFDFGLFDNLSDSKQRDYLLSYFPVHCTRNDVWNAIRDGIKQDDDSYNSFVPFWRSIARDVVLSFPKISDKSPLELLSFTADAITEKFNRLSLEAEKAIHAAEKINEISHETERIATQLATLKSAEKTVQDAIDGLRKEIASGETIIAQHQKLCKEIELTEQMEQPENPEELTVRLETAKRGMAEKKRILATAKEKREQIQKEMTELSSQLKVMEKRSSVSLQIRNADKNIADYTAEIQEVPELDHARNEEESAEKGRLSVRLDEKNSRISVTKEYIRTLETIVNHPEEEGHCPICANPIDREIFRGQLNEYQNHLKEISREQKELADKVGVYESKGRNFALQVDRATRIESANKRVNEKVVKAKTERDELTIQLNSLEDFPESQKEYDKQNSLLTGVNEEIKLLESGISEREELATNLQKNLTTALEAREKLAGLNQLVKQRNEIILPDLAQKQAILDTNLEKLSQIKADIETRQQQERDKFLEMKNLQQQNQAIDQSRAYKVAAQAIGPKGFKGELLKKELQPFIAGVNSALDHAGLSEYTFIIQMVDQRGNEVFSPGVLHNNLMVTFKTINTAHRLMFIFCFIGALQDSGYSAILIDNLEVIDESNERHLVNIVENQKAGNILIACSRGRWTSDRIKIHRTGESVNDYLSTLDSKNGNQEK